jgi:hypothetical protein
VRTALAFSFLVVGACDRPPDTITKVCDKVVTLSGNTSPRQKDECHAQLAALGPNVRACFDPCIIERARDKVDYEVCKDECTSREGFAGTMCLVGYMPDEPGRTSCVAALGPLEKTDRAKLSCIGRCRKESAQPPEMDACAQRCGGPALPPRKTNVPPPAVSF